MDNRCRPRCGPAAAYIHVRELRGRAGLYQRCGRNSRSERSSSSDHHRMGPRHRAVVDARHQGSSHQRFHSRRQDGRAGESRAVSARVLVIFLDGMGIGGDDAEVNPFRRARMPAFTGLQALGTFVPLDATLGVAGLPQSGTGQTALFTGINAAREFGRHFGPWVPTALHERLARENLLTIAKNAGRSVAFANAYPEELFAKDVTVSRKVR